MIPACFTNTTWQTLREQPIPPRRPHISHRLTACGTTRQPADSTDTDRPIACLGCLVLPWEFGYLAGFLDLISNQREILPTPEFLS
jgi:hypothetical protein